MFLLPNKNRLHFIIQSLRLKNLPKTILKNIFDFSPKNPTKINYICHGSSYHTEETEKQR